MSDELHDEGGATRDQRASVAQAAQMLGISEGAVRKRVERGKMRAERDAAGRLIVYLDHDTTATDTTRDRPRQSRGNPERYTRSLEEQVEYLRRQLERRDEELREHRRLLAGLIERVPELEAASSSEAREAPESAGPSATPTDAGEGRETGTRRPWWRRIFGS